MVKVTENKNKGEKSQYRGDNIVVTIDQLERIIKINDKCEKICGYSLKESQNKQLINFLIPERYSKHWKKLFDSACKNKQIEDFKLPIKTKNGHEIMISWSSFPIKDDGGIVDEVSLVGKLILSWNDFEENIFTDFSNKKNPYRKQADPIGKGLYSVSELFGRGGSKEFEIRMKELAEREKILNDFEETLLNDKKEINDRIIEFHKWRERLEILEDEIENRRENVLKREKILDARITAASDAKGLSVKEVREIDVDYHDILDKISDSAAVLQRGILKQVNPAFAELLGYESDEVVEKSLFDFILPESFNEIEEYYLNRLKGIDVSIYETAFLTKDNKKIIVEVNTRPTILNGEKAEIAVFKKVSTQENNIKKDKKEKE